jgi:hypothetical protein
MSIRHEVTIHCDSCAYWEVGDDQTTRQRRRRGWLIWQNKDNQWRHACPNCSSGTCWICEKPVTRSTVTPDGEANSFWATTDLSICLYGHFHEAGPR